MNVLTCTINRQMAFHQRYTANWMKGGKEEFDLAFPENLIQQAQTM